MKAENKVTKAIEIDYNEDKRRDDERTADWTRYAYELNEMKRHRLTFEQAAAKVADTRAKIRARQRTTA